MKTINIEGKDFNIEQLKELIKNSESNVGYPIYCEYLGTDEVAKFTSSDEATIVKNSSRIPLGFIVGQVLTGCTPHTDRNEWKQLPICPKTGFFHGQLVWAWDRDYANVRMLLFYNANKSCIFPFTNGSATFAYDNYLPFEGNWPDWALEAHKTLEL